MAFMLQFESSAYVSWFSAVMYCVLLRLTMYRKPRISNANVHPVLYL